MINTWGRQFFSCNYDQLSFALYNKGQFKVIVLDDDADKYKRIGCYMMSVLLPPYPAIEAEINGNLPLAKNLYNQYLQSEGSIMVFAAITRALFGGENVLIFISPDEAKNLSFADVLCRFMSSFLGFPSADITGFNDPQCGALNMHPISVSERLDLIYTYGYIPFDTYCDNHPNIIPRDAACMKIAHDIQEPGLLQLSPEDRMRACADIVISARDQRVALYGKFGEKANNLAPCPIVELHDFQRRIVKERT